MRPGRRLAAAPVAALAVTAMCTGIAACAAPIPGPSLTLALASPDLPTDPNAALVQRFADDVARLSRNAIQIQPRWDASPPGTQGANQWVATEVADGTYDLGLVPSLAFDELGVTSLQALTAPFLIQSRDLLRAVLDSPQREQLLTGLPAAGVVGVDLFPAQFVHPFGFDAPLLGLADYEGSVIQAPSSIAAGDLLGTFGAVVTDAEVGTADMRGQGSGYAWMVTGIATGNVTFFPRVETLIMDAEVRQRLRADQWELLVRAAADTRTWAFEYLPSELESAAAFCRADGRIVAATAAERTQLERAGDSVTSRLRAGDVATARIIDAIVALKATYPASDDVVACPELRELPITAQASALNGIYHFVASAHALRAAGVGNRLVDENAGDYTITLKDGRWSAAQVYETGPHQGTTWHGSGNYTVDDGVLTFYWPVGLDDDWSRAAVTVESDGSLRFSDPTGGRKGDWTLMDRVVFVHWDRIDIAR